MSDWTLLNQHRVSEPMPSLCSALADVALVVMRELDDDNGYEHTQELNGSTAFVFNVKNRGQQITVSGWHPNHHKFKAGERVLLIQKSGEATRYRIKEVQRPGNPHDQYFMDCDFAPRRAQSSNDPSSATAAEKRSD